MLTIKNLDKINGIPIVNDGWMLYSTVSTTLNTYNFLVLKNRSEIEAYPNYSIRISRKTPTRLTVTHKHSPYASQVLFDDTFTISSKDTFIEQIEKIIRT